MMVSKILRRSGSAVVQFCQKLGWHPDSVYLVGVGNHHQETDVMREEWKEFELFGWEPNPYTHENILPTFPGYLYNEAVSSEVGTATLSHPVNHKDGGSLHSESTILNTDGFHTHTVNTTTLDHWAEERNHLEFKRGLLWIDVEGNELEVLKGAIKFLKQTDIQVINVELTGLPYYSGWADPKDVHDLLKKQGYRPSWVHSIRIPIMQRDVIFVREDIYDPTCSCFPLGG